MWQQILSSFFKNVQLKSTVVIDDVLHFEGTASSILFVISVDSNIYLTTNPITVFTCVTEDGYNGIFLYAMIYGGQPCLVFYTGVSSPVFLFESIASKRLGFCFDFYWQGASFKVKVSRFRADMDPESHIIDLASDVGDTKSALGMYDFDTSSWVLQSNLLANFHGMYSVPRRLTQSEINSFFKAHALRT